MFVCMNKYICMQTPPRGKDQKSPNFCEGSWGPGGHCYFFSKLASVGQLGLSGKGRGKDYMSNE